MTSRDLVAIDGTMAPADLAPARLFGSGTARDTVRQATEIASALRDVIAGQKLYKTISGRDHILVEGWTLLGTLVGVFPRVVWSRPLPDGNGFEARVEAATMAGAVVGAAEAQCSKDEPTWASRPDYALRSMAQTRATSKAMRVPLGFVVTLAGYEATPAEEMDGIEVERPAQRQPSSNARPAPQPTMVPMPQRDAIPAQARVVSESPTVARTMSGGALATEPQVKAVYGYGKARRWDAERVKAECMERYGCEPENLTRAQASAFIDILKTAPDAE